MSQKNADNAEQNKQDQAVDPFALRETFPDAQGIFTARHQTLAEVKNDSFVALDANVLLLPFTFNTVDIKAVAEFYRPLVREKRLIIPAQAAREFAKHRSNKVGDLVKYLRDQSSATGPRLDKKIGALSQDERFKAVLKQIDELTKQTKVVQKSLSAIAQSVAENVGEDPVSIVYRDLFSDVVRADPADCNDPKTFREELKARFEARRPPGYKDNGKPDGGAGDLIIWKTILAEGKARKQHCIFVTADRKSDWYVQSDGAFQPRLELMEEFRNECGRTIHIVPLSKLLETFNVSDKVINEVKSAEKASSGQADTFATWNNFLGKELEKKSRTNNVDFAEQKIRLDKELESIELLLSYARHLDNESDTAALLNRKSMIQNKLFAVEWAMHQMRD